MEAALEHGVFQGRYTILGSVALWGQILQECATAVQLPW